MNLKEVGQLNLLTALVWGEARGEPYDGKFAVACVVINRKNDPRWPDTIEDVILQRLQFSCFNLNDNNHHEVLNAVIPSRNWSNMTWRECRSASQLALGRWREDITRGANHYLATWFKKKPSWAVENCITANIGWHIFYKL